MRIPRDTRHFHCMLFRVLCGIGDGKFDVGVVFIGYFVLSWFGGGGVGFEFVCVRVCEENSKR